MLDPRRIESMLDRLPEELKKRFEVSNGCWKWKGRKTKEGYGLVTPYAHRMLYEMLIGAIQEGLVLDHVCRNRDCVNPAHLEAVTQRENILRGESVPAGRSRQTECIHGHPFDEVNTQWLVLKGNKVRRCRACANRIKREYYNERPKGKKSFLPKRTHCKKGHEMTPENTYTWTSKGGRIVKYCWACRLKKG